MVHISIPRRHDFIHPHSNDGQCPLRRPQESARNRSANTSTAGRAGRPLQAPDRTSGRRITTVRRKTRRPPGGSAPRKREGAPRAPHSPDRQAPKGGAKPPASPAPQKPHPAAKRKTAQRPTPAHPGEKPPPGKRQTPAAGPQVGPPPSANTSPSPTRAAGAGVPFFNV